MSKTAFYRKMHTLTGQTPYQFIRFNAVKTSQGLIKGKVGNILEIAFAVGFNNLSYFTRCFQKQFGRLPSEIKQLSS